MKKQRVTAFLTFNGKAEEAMTFYATVFPDTKIEKLSYYGKNHPMAKDGDENKVLHGLLSLMGQEIIFLDMVKAYPAPDFSWASSILVDCKDEAEFDLIFNALAKNGNIMMGPEAVENIRKCAWVVDKFGVVWQPVWE